MCFDFTKIIIETERSFSQELELDNNGVIDSANIHVMLETLA